MPFHSSFGSKTVPVYPGKEELPNLEYLFSDQVVGLEVTPKAKLLLIPLIFPSVGYMLNMSPPSPFGPPLLPPHQDLGIKCSLFQASPSLE